MASPSPAATFAEDLAFLKKYVDVIVLANRSGSAQVAIVPAWQGRIMTSTAEGDGGLSFGWLNRELIASGTFQPHMNTFGGEDRFWLGPEGGQFSIFFAKGVPFDLDHWFTPAPIDTQPFRVTKRGDTRASFAHKFSLTNYSGTVFNVEVDREIRMMSASQTWRRLGLEAVPGLNLVAFETLNSIGNKGTEPWTPETGLLSVWILGMFNPSPATTIVIPIRSGPEAELGKPVNADYFGTVPADRLVVKDDMVFFSGDGKYRSKIGINPKRARHPKRAMPVMGSYDAAHKVLTLVQYSLPKNATRYVNSMWEIQKDPYAGDAANSYNDGPPSPGAKPLGPFYELESSSPPAALKPGQWLEHIHRTVHLSGPEEALDTVAQAALGVTLQDIARALPKP
ncbi:MAG: hypothetical protein JXQ71_00200 [Verrucomicrobia bacterium]|nr:hypothetical protein [Verrucomicrobiota bacterium]